jgi:iron complex transport system ATP-binding protein
MTLTAEHIHYAYDSDQPVLHDISLSLGGGEILYLLGRNGSGKTTLLSCLSGVLEPAQGRIQIAGVDLAALRPIERARRIGLIPQIHLPGFAYSVRQMVLMGRAPHLNLLAVPGEADRAIADDALASVGMSDYADRAYTDLSGGERQMVMIARGLTQQCDILLMDEPDAHLDPYNRHKVMAIVSRLARQGLSFIVSSHAPNNALLYAGQVLLLKRGRVMALGPTLDTLTAPLLSETYDMSLEVLYDRQNGRQIPRAILTNRLD